MIKIINNNSTKIMNNIELELAKIAEECLHKNYKLHENYAKDYGLLQGEFTSNAYY